MSLQTFPPFFTICPGNFMSNILALSFPKLCLIVSSLSVLSIHVFSGLSIDLSPLD